MPTLRQTLHRISWSLGDQALSSVSNVLLSILFARLLSVEMFGAFGIAYSCYQVTLGTTRAVVGEPTLIRTGRQAASASSTSSDAAAVAGAALAVGTFAGSVIAIVGAFLPSPVSDALFALAIGMPGLMMFDGLRYWCFAVKQPKRAAVIDGLWLLIQVLLLLIFVVLHWRSIYALMFAWEVGAAVGAGTMLIQCGTYPRIKETGQWFRKNLDMSPRFLGEYVTISGVQQGLVFFTVAFASLAGVAAVRGAQVIMGPMNIVSMGVSVMVLPELSRRASTDRKRLLQLSTLVSTCLGGAMILYATVVSWIPTSVGESVLGANWHAGRSLLWFSALAFCANGVSYGATAGIRSLEQLRTSFWLRVFTAPIVLGLIAAGAYFGGARGGVTGAFVGASLQCVSWWVAYGIVWKRSTRLGVGRMATAIPQSH